VRKDKDNLLSLVVTKLEHLICNQ